MRCTGASDAYNRPGRSNAPVQGADARVFKSPSIMPLFALGAGVALLTLEMRNPGGVGGGFWKAFAVGMIVLALGGFLWGAKSARGDTHDDPPPPR